MTKRIFNRDANVIETMPDELDEVISAAIMAVEPVGDDPVENEKEYAGGDKLGNRGNGNAVDEFLWNHSSSPEHYDALVRKLRAVANMYSSLGRWEEVEEGDADGN